MTFFRNLSRRHFIPPQGPIPGVHFRRACQSDEEALSKSCYAHHSPDHFREEFRRSLRAQAAGNRVHLLAISRRRPIGSGQLIAYTPRVEIADLIVDAPYRDQGIGTALIRILVQIAGHAGFGSVEIGVMAANERALTLYKRLGFTMKKEIALPGPARAIVLHKTTTTPQHNPH